MNFGGYNIDSSGREFRMVGRSEETEKMSRRCNVAGLWPLSLALSWFPCSAWDHVGLSFSFGKTICLQLLWQCRAYNMCTACSQGGSKGTFRDFDDG